jgi:hypothetical protein
MLSAHGARTHYTSFFSLAPYAVLRGEEIPRSSANQIVFGANTAQAQHALIGGNVATFTILHKKCGGGRVIH